VLTPLQKRTRSAKRLLASRGLVEAVTWSFISAKQAEAFGGGSAELTLSNPIASELSDMRPSLLPGLLAAGQRNADRSIHDIALFEVGQVFKGANPSQQKITAAGLRRGLAASGGLGRHWSVNEKTQSANLFDVKADAIALMSALGVAVERLQLVQGGPSWLHPGRSGTFQFGPKDVMGVFGELHPGLAATLGLDAPCMVFEITLDALPLPKAKSTKVKPKLNLPDLQPVRRDFAFIAEKTVSAEDLLKIARGIDRALVSEVSVFDNYEGKGIEPGKRSVGIAVTLQPQERSLTDAEIEAFAARLVAETARKTGATLR
jgi:phenylalanyl-tRNA synthetase beta chain